MYEWRLGEGRKEVIYGREWREILLANGTGIILLYQRISNILSVPLLLLLTVGLQIQLHSFQLRSIVSARKKRGGGDKIPHPHILRIHPSLSVCSVYSTAEWMMINRKKSIHRDAANYYDSPPLAQPSVHPPTGGQPTSQAVGLRGRDRRQLFLRLLVLIVSDSRLSVARGITRRRLVLLHLSSSHNQPATHLHLGRYRQCVSISFICPVHRVFKLFIGPRFCSLRCFVLNKKVPPKWRDNAI